MIARESFAPLPVLKTECHFSWSDLSPLLNYRFNGGEQVLDGCLVLNLGDWHAEVAGGDLLSEQLEPPRLYVHQTSSV